MVELVKQNLSINIKKYSNSVKELRKVLDKDVPITHVGSTSIPNMYGKNIIDILIGVRNENEMNNFTNSLNKIGYFSGTKCTDVIYRFLASSKEETKSGDVHLHLVNIDSDRYKDFIILKEYLLSNKNEVKSYSNFKKKILKSGNNERKDYKTIKSEYVNKLLIRAKEFAIKNKS